MMHRSGDPASRIALISSCTSISLAAENDIHLLPFQYSGAEVKQFATKSERINSGAHFVPFRRPSSMKYVFGLARECAVRASHGAAEHRPESDRGLPWAIGESPAIPRCLTMNQVRMAFLIRRCERQHHRLSRAEKAEIGSFVTEH